MAEEQTVAGTNDGNVGTVEETEVERTRLGGGAVGGCGQRDDD